MWLDRVSNPGPLALSQTCYRLGYMAQFFFSIYQCLTYVSQIPICSVKFHSDQILNTLKCLSIGTLKTINFPFVSNEKLMVFRCPNIQAHYNEAVIYLNFGTPKKNEFSIWNKWKIYYF